MRTSPERPNETGTFDPFRVIRILHELLEVSRSEELFEVLGEYFVPDHARACLLESSDWQEPKVIASGSSASVQERGAVGGEQRLRFPFRFGNGKSGALVLTGDRPFQKSENREVFEIGACGALALGKLLSLEGAGQALDQKEKMLRMVTHEFKTPLTTIQIGMDLLKPSKARDNFLAADLQARMERSVKRMRGLVGGLLEASRYSAGREGSVDRKPVRLRELVEEVVASKRGDLQEKGLGLQQEWEAASPTIEADPEGLYQVFAHLIGNAIKFSPKKGVIRLKAKCVGSSWRFTIEDEGPGIPVKELDRVFESFWQANRENGAVTVGLGLFIVKSVVEAHGGRVRAGNREDGVGAIFSFALPIRPEDDKLGSHRRAGSHD